MASTTPTAKTRLVAHALVGAVAAYLVGKMFRAGAGEAVVCALVVAFAHEKLDAPAARRMAALGVRL